MHAFIAYHIVCDICRMLINNDIPDICLCDRCCLRDQFFFTVVARLLQHVAVAYQTFLIDKRCRGRTSIKSFGLARLEAHWDAIAGANGPSKLIEHSGLPLTTVPSKLLMKLPQKMRSVSHFDDRDFLLLKKCWCDRLRIHKSL